MTLDVIKKLQVYFCVWIIIRGESFEQSLQTWGARFLMCELIQYVSYKIPLLSILSKLYEEYEYNALIFGGLLKQFLQFFSKFSNVR